MIPPKLIAEYFYEFQKVSFDGIGTLERKHKSAKADVADKVFVPPTAYIEFTPEVSNSDAFVKYIAVTQNLTQKEAELKIQQFVTQLKAVLESKQEYPLDKLGKFLYDKNTKKITFEQNPDAFVDSPFYFGLGEAHFLPVSHGKLSGSEKKESSKQEIEKIGSNFVKNTANVPKITAQELKQSLEAIEKKEEEQKNEQSSPSKKMLIIGISMGIIAFFIVLVFGLSYFFPSLDALHVYHKKRDSNKVENKVVQQDSVQHSHKDTTLHPNKEPQNSTETHNLSVGNAPTHSNIVNEATGNTGTYHIIAASFASVDIASSHVTEWQAKGYNAQTVPSRNGNKYRLSIYQTDKEQDALNTLTEYKTKTGKSDLWILYQ